MNRIFKVVFCIIGALIGAGFASGQEIYSFFYSYGFKGIYGLIVCSLLIGFIIYKAFKIIINNNINTYNDFLEILVNKLKIKNKFKVENKFFNITFIINIIINIFLLITFFIMIAGFGAYLEQELNINSFLGCLIFAVLCFVIFMTDVKGVIKVNEFIVPILIIFIIMVGIINFWYIDFENCKNNLVQVKFDSWILSSILYCSYNSILLIPVLITLKDFINRKEDIKIISIFSATIVFILALIIYLLLMRVDIDINKLEMPVVYVITNFFRIFKKVYGFIILASIFTTSISIGISFLQNTVKNKKNYTQVAIIMCITSLIISRFGFSNLVNLLYPIFGYLGLIQILFIL